MFKKVIFIMQVKWTVKINTLYWNNIKSWEGWEDNLEGELPFTQASLDTYPLYP